MSAKYVHMKFQISMYSNSTDDRYVYGGNFTAQNGTAMPEIVHYHEHTSIWLVTFIGFSAINILVSFILALCAVLNNPKLRRFLFVWIGWTCMCIGLELMRLIATLAFRSVHMAVVQILINVFAIFYELLCLWIVSSYYKLLANEANTPGEGYNAFFNSADSEFVDDNENQKPLQTV